MASAVPDLLEVEVDEDGIVVWKPARVIRRLERGRFQVCVNGDGDFIEEYGPDDEGTEWRTPTAAQIPHLLQAYAVAEAHAAALEASHTMDMASSSGVAQGASDPLLLGEIIEVEVVSDEPSQDGQQSTVWRPAKVLSALPDGSFTACVNGEGDFIETYRMDEELSEWRRVATEALPTVEAQYDAAAAAWAAAVQSGTAQSVSDAWVVEQVVAQRRLSKAKGHAIQYLVKWRGFEHDQNTWEPEANLAGCLGLIEQFNAEKAKWRARGKEQHRPEAAAAVQEQEEEEGEDDDEEEEGSDGDGSVVTTDLESKDAETTEDEDDEEDESEDDSRHGARGRRRANRGASRRGRGARGAVHRTHRRDRGSTPLLASHTPVDQRRLSSGAVPCASPVLTSLMPILPVGASLLAGADVLVPPLRLRVVLHSGSKPSSVRPEQRARSSRKSRRIDAHVDGGRMLSVDTAASDEEGAPDEMAGANEAQERQRAQHENANISLEGSEPRNKGVKEATLPCNGIVEARSDDDEVQAYLCNAARAIWAVCWLPTESPSDVQHLAVGTHVDGATHSLTSGPNAIQLWQLVAHDADLASDSCHRTGQGSTKSRSSFSRTCGSPDAGAGEGDVQRLGTNAGARPWLNLMHNGAGVLALCWCPRGNAIDAPSQVGVSMEPGPDGTAGTHGDLHPSSNQLSLSKNSSSSSQGTTLSRLGLLAASCADGRVRVFAVPTRTSLTRMNGWTHPIGNPRPSVPSCAPRGLWLPPVLQLEPSAPVLTLSLSWCASSVHLLACGMDDGTIKVWDVSSTPQRVTAKRHAGNDANDPNVGADEYVVTDAPSKSATPDVRGVEAAIPALAPSEEADNEPGAPLGRMLVPHCILGTSSRLGGTLASAYSRAHTANTSALGHAAPVRSVRWSNPPNELLASVGHDGLLYVWDPNLAFPQLQRHEVVPYAWALDLAWSPVAPAIIVCADEPFLYSVPLRNDLPLGTKATALNEVAGTCVWALSCNASGDRLACVTSSGRLEIFEDRGQSGRLTAQGYLQLEIQQAAPAHGSGIAGSTPSCASPALTDATQAQASTTVAIGKAARPSKANDKGNELPPSSIGLRCLQWNTNASHDEWLACGTGSGLLIIMKAPRDGS